MAKSGSSGRWLQEHERDPYVQRARRDGYRSRASYKLLELDAKDKVLRPGAVVLDLGAAPGGWSQVAAARVGRAGRVIATDILPMDSLPGVDFVQGDFTEQETLDRLLEMLGGAGVDLVMSDMAPNMSGVRAVDQPRAMHLVELAVDVATRVLKPGGVLLTKVFQGENFQDMLVQLRQSYRTVASRKPEASRARSRELYWVAKGFRGD